MSRLAVVLVSGGLDSATVLAIARHEGYSCHAITFDYGQRHRVELEASRRVSESIGVESHRTIVLDTAAFRGSALTDGGDVPKGRDMDAMSEGIPDGAIVSIDPEASGRHRRTNRSEDGRKVKQRPGMWNKPREMIR